LRTTKSFAINAEKIVNQIGNVFGPLSQRWDVQRYNVESVEKIGAKALALHFIGACLATGNVLLGVGTLFVTLPTFVIRAQAEEQLLRERFGAAYDRYADEVPMLVPGPRRAGRPGRRPPTARS